MLDFLKPKAATADRQPVPSVVPEAKPVPTPGARRKRLFWRPIQAGRSLLNAARPDRLTQDWPTTPVPADEIISRYQRVVVARSRHACVNNDYVKHYLRRARQNIVGPAGIQLQAQAKDPDGSLDSRANDAIETGWRDWSKRRNCDVTGKQSLAEIERAAVSGAVRDGEFMIRIVTGSDAGPWGFALQVLDPHRCPVDHDVERLGNGHFVRHGIEFNRFGRPMAFHFQTLDASEKDYSFGGRSFVRIPADDIIHGYRSEMVGQKRGLPWTVTALLRAQHLAGFEEAAIVNARTAASKGGFFQWREDATAPDYEEERDEPFYMDAEPGSFQELPYGLEFKSWEPQFPSGDYLPFTKQQLRGMAAGLGITYHDLANDLEGVNFSSVRSGTLAEREGWKEDQAWLIEQLMQPLFERWLPFALLKGLKIPGTNGTLRPDRLDKYSDVIWQGRRWDWVDPDKDSKAADRDLKNTLKAPSQIMRERGDDPRQVWRQFADDIQAMRDEGIPEAIIQAAISGAAAPATPAAGENSDEGQ
ncbi:phage portal protein [Halomonas sp. MMSF_3323]|uniref:phage portal protein n=1 Tax=Halomonas sp. MMSF_3323 TaxID=3046701 RepID=UPI00273F0073|nr:phage portal protein [Halomonas sp. MMSF_3323]